MNVKMAPVGAMSLSTLMRKGMLASFKSQCGFEIDNLGLGLARLF